MCILEIQRAYPTLTAINDPEEGKKEDTPGPFYEDWQEVRNSPNKNDYVVIGELERLNGERAN